MNAKMAVAVGGVLVAGIVVLWPRGGGQVDGVATVAGVPGVAVEDSGAERVEAAVATGGPSLHARIVTAALDAPPIATLPGWDDIPAPVLVPGPPGKPGFMEGATKAEVLAVWGHPALVRPGRNYRQVGMFEAAGLTGMRHLEQWQYETENGLKAFGFFDDDGRLWRGTPHPIDVHRYSLVVEDDRDNPPVEQVGAVEVDYPEETPESAGLKAYVMERFMEERKARIKAITPTGPGLE